MTNILVWSCRTHAYELGLVHMGSQVQKFQFTWGQFVQSLPMRTWKFGLATSHWAQVLRANSHGVPNPKAQVTWHQPVQFQALSAWKLRLSTSNGVPSFVQLWHGCLQGNTFWRWGLGLVLQVGSSKKLDPTLNPSPANIFAEYNQNPILVLFNHVSVGTLPPCWDLLTWVRLETTYELALSPKYDLDADIAIFFNNEAHHLCWVESRKMLDPTLNTNLEILYVK